MNKKRTAKKILLDREENQIDRNVAKAVSLPSREKKKILSSIQSEKREPKISITIRLDKSLLEDIKNLAQQLEIPYQTLISKVLKEYVGSKIDPEIEKRFTHLVKKALNELSADDLRVLSQK